MRLINPLRAITAFLCHMYLTVLGCFVLWAILPLMLGWTPTLVSSGSMEPRIHTGDIIYADPMSPEEIKDTVLINHVLLADDPGMPDRLVTHRVQEIQDGGNAFITKGDANPSADSTPVPLANVHGIEKFRVPYLGIPILALQRGNFLVAGLFILSLILAQLLVRFQWKLDDEAERKRKSELEPETFVANPENDSPQKVKTFAILLLPVFFVVSSFILTSSSAAWNNTTANHGNTFEVCSALETDMSTGLVYCLNGVKL